ncbi:MULTISPECIES: methyl-accepting chemotaxis protein [unclassified Paenibacillus]|uniref:methyl-accepting chemotaxis protein n=1 Tax=unclassified Paenibacillus TaxID=185978 RepID=UPI00096CB003|nr:methyl-accepting chemotaxis protein [Paenibacillus sp. FSL R7-0333]
MKINIRLKMLLAFFVVVALLFVSSTASLLSLNKLGETAKDIDSHWMPSVTILGTLNGDVSDVERLALNLVLEQNTAQRDKVQADYNDVLKKVDDGLKVYEALISSDEEREIYKGFTEQYASYLAKLPEIISAGEAKDYGKANMLHKESYGLWYNANNTIMKLIELNNSGAALMNDEAVANYVSGQRMIIVFSAAAILVAIVISILLSNSISRPVLRISRAAERIAGGDLTGEPVTVKSRDEMHTLSLAFNAMVQNLRSLIQAVNATTELVVTSSEELTASAEQSSQASMQITETMQEVASGAALQVDMVGKSTQAIEEMSVGVEQIAVRAQSVFASAQGAAQKSAEGNQRIQEAVTQMNAVNQSVTELGGMMSALGERSNEIGKIVSVITGIAGQTNLLALNAAIEAARAGEQGRGFAVVAGEVRKLAEQSAGSAQQITELVEAIQSDTVTAIEAVTLNGQDVAAGLEAVRSAGNSFEHILNTVNQVTGEIEEVSAGSEQLSAGTDEVVNFIKQISVAAENGAAGTQHVSAATEEQLASMEGISASAASLSTIAEELQEQIGKFKV